jgi:hypothetical protein
MRKNTWVQTLTVQQITSPLPCFPRIPPSCTFLSGHSRYEEMRVSYTGSLDCSQADVIGDPKQKGFLHPTTSRTSRRNEEQASSGGCKCVIM